MAETATLARMWQIILPSVGVFYGVFLAFMLQLAFSAATNATQLQVYVSAINLGTNVSEFVLKGEELRRIEAWKRGKQGKIRREYDIAAIGDMTVGLLFFLMAYLSNWYEKVIELDKSGYLRIGS